MKNNSVDKSKSEPLTRVDRSKYKGMQEYYRSRIEHFKRELDRLNNLNKKCIAIIKKHRDKIESLKISSTDSWSTGLKDKVASEKWRVYLQVSEAAIKHQRDKIVKNKDLIKEARSEAMTYWRELEKHKKLVSAEIPWGKKNL